MLSIVELRNLTVAYERHPALHHVTGGFERGSLTAVIGPNGAGKSTLLKAIAGLQKPTEGSAALHGLKPTEVAYLPQMVTIDESFPITVFDVVLLGHWGRVGPFRSIGPAMHEAASRALATVGLEGFEQRSFGSLSAGQRQRVLFARVLVADSPLILLDEPFTAVDSRTTDDLLRLVRRWHSEGRTVVAVLHDFEQVRRHFPQALLLAREPIAWGETPAVLTTDNLRAARAMSEAWDADADICRGAA